MSFLITLIGPQVRAARSPSPRRRLSRCRARGGVAQDSGFVREREGKSIRSVLRERGAKFNIIHTEQSNIKKSK